MASASASSLTLQPLLSRSNLTTQAIHRNSVMVAPMGWTKCGFPSLKSSSFRVTCAAKPETTQKVCDIVRTQLALPAETQLTPESKFSELGADSLDTVEIVMGLEEEFGIAVEEDNAQSIATIQDAAELIDILVEQKAESGS